MGDGEAATGAATLPPSATLEAPTPLSESAAQPTDAPGAEVPSTGKESDVLICTAPAPLTPAMTEGPYYTPDTPERTSLLEEGMEGTVLILTGYVLTSDCQPVANAWLDFWQTDAQGEYDNSGYRLRGHQFTDEQGRYRLETVIPGIYPGRTAHIHVKVQAPGGPELTTQLFIPGEPQNQTDRIFAEELVVQFQESGERVGATFDFVVEAP
jgi:protocatechuate 3,4-dioxygenase beta subunit